MAGFQYKGINQQGRVVRGELEAENEIDLEQRLKRSAVMLIRAKKVKTKTGKSIFKRKKIERKDIIVLSIHMHRLLKAGVPILESLQDLRDSTEHPYLRDIIAEIHEDVSNGQHLSQALAKHPHVFSPLYISLVQSAENTGNLNEAFYNLVSYMKWQDELITRIRKMATYPTILFCVTIAVVILLMVKVVPALLEILGELGQSEKDLPAVTRSLMMTSRFFVDYGLLLGVGLSIIGVSLAVAIRRSTRVGLFYDIIKLRLPIFGDTLHKIALSRFAKYLGILYRSGIPVIEALKTTRNVVINRFIAQNIDWVVDQVSAGTSISESLKATGQFPALVVRMIKIGEDTGRLDTSLEEVSNFYDQEINAAIDQVIGILQPLITIVMGVLVAWVIAGILLPYYDILGNI